MTGPDREHPASFDADKNRAESTPFYLASRFAGEAAAGRVYFRAQERIFHSPTSEISVYRFQLSRIYHVAILGEVPPEPLHEQLRGLLSAGELVTLPENVLALLLARRAAANSQATWLEGHYRPGMPM